jgi:signal transduction histidine kinase
MERLVVTVAMVRAVLVGRVIVLLATIAASIRLVDDPARPALALGLVTVVSAGELVLIARHPSVLRRRVAVLIPEVVVTVAVLVISKGGLAYFGYAAGSCLLAGVLLGTGGLVIWLAQAALGLCAIADVLRSVTPDARSVLAPFLVTIPVGDILAGLGAAALASGLTHYIKLSVENAAAAQRTAAADERARLARELHDSVAKTLRGVSFAALALPSSLRRQPDLAEQLAETVSAGAEAAQREARELLAALRRDVPDQPFAETVRGTCEAWQATTGISVTLDLRTAEPPLATRYELTQILHEALRNVAQHAGADWVEVVLAPSAGQVQLTVRDNGTGFTVPSDLSELSTRGSFGVVGMSERARAAGGRLAVVSRLGGGTVVAVTVPALPVARGVGSR